MKAQTMVDVVFVFVAIVPSLLHQNHIGVTYSCTSNFKMELVRFVPLYFMAMPQSIIIVIEPSFVSTPIHIIDGFRSRTQTPRTIEFVSLHENILGDVNKIYAS
jgi:hypothetical protein